VDFDDVSTLLTKKYLVNKQIQNHIMTEKELPLLNKPDQAQSSYDYTEETSSFYNLLATIIKYKVSILTITSIFTLFAILYAQKLPLIYQASIELVEPQGAFSPNLPPHITELLMENLPSHITEPLTGKPTPFSRFSSMLMSFSSIEAAFRDGNFLKKFHGENSTIPQEDAALLAYDSISVVKKKKGEKAYKNITVQMTGTKPRVIADFLTALAESTKQITVKEFKNQLEKIIDFKIQETIAKINFLNLSLKRQELQRIAIFSEALKIAQKLGIKDTNFERIQNSNFLGTGEGVDTDVPVWYLYGEKALSLELEKVKNRTVEQANLLKRTENNELLEQEDKLKLFKSINLSQINLKVFHISRPSTIPKSPIKPNKRIIVIQGMAFGLFIGIFLALLRGAIDRLKKEQSSLSTQENQQKPTESSF